MKHSTSLLIFLIAVFYIQAQTPQLWGVKSFGGSGVGQGNIFRINGDGTGYTEIHPCAGFVGLADCNSPVGNIVPASSSLIYGMSGASGVNGLGDIFSYHTATRVYTSLFSMDSASGIYPWGTLLLASDNNLYGLTSNGGTFDKGVLFRFDPSSLVYSKLHEFDSITGQFPNSSLVQADNGKIYGVAASGGNNSFGTLFSYDISSSTFTVVHHFSISTGRLPFGKLLKASNGLLYGTTTIGGSTGGGTIFSFNPATNVYTNLHELADGNFPYWGSLAEGAGSILYGTTSQGGANSGGVIFRYNPNTNVYTKLHDFAEATGWKPRGNVTLASDGNLYGATVFGGDDNFGVVYSYHLSTNTYSVLHHGSIAQGGWCNNELIEFDAIVNIEPIFQQDLISVHPNPSNGFITVKLQDAVHQDVLLSVMNGMGQTVDAIKLNSNREEIRLHYPPGIYILTFIQNDKRWTRKVVVG